MTHTPDTSIDAKTWNDPTSRRALRRLVRILIPVAVFVTALGVLWHELRGIDPADVWRELGETSTLGLLAAALLTGLSYITLTGYDWVGLRYIGRAQPYEKTGWISFVAYAISNNVGLAGMGGAPIRYRYFLSLGVSGGDVVRVVAFGYLTFWAGFLLLAGILFSWEPLPVPELLDLPWADTRPIGLFFIVALLAYLAWGLQKTRKLRIGGWTLRAPGKRMEGLQLALGAADWLLAGAALYVLLPPEADPGLVQFLVVYLFAQTAGLVSTVPGGLGVFETITALFLSNEASAPALFSALLIYRLIYYLIPLMVAVVALIVIQVNEHRAERAQQNASS